MSDDLKKARRGDRDALTRVLEVTETRLRNLTQSRLGQGLKKFAHTSDILQNAYLDVVRSVESFSGGDVDEFVKWVGRIVENNIRDMRRFHSAKKRSGAAEVTPFTQHLIDRISASSATPSKETTFNEDLRTFAECLEALPEDHRQVILLRKIEQRPIAEVATLMKRSEAATRKLLSRAMAALILSLDDGGTPVSPKDLEYPEA